MTLCTVSMRKVLIIVMNYKTVFHIKDGKLFFVLSALVIKVGL